MIQTAKTDPVPVTVARVLGVPVIALAILLGAASSVEIQAAPMAAVAQVDGDR